MFPGAPDALCRPVEPGCSEALFHSGTLPAKPQIRRPPVTQSPEPKPLRLYPATAHLRTHAPVRSVPGIRRLRSRLSAYELYAAGCAPFPYRRAISPVASPRRSASGRVPPRFQKTAGGDPTSGPRAEESHFHLDSPVGRAAIVMHHLKLFRQAQQAFGMPDKQIPLGI